MTGVPKTEPLTDLQKTYIWLAGSYPEKVVQQGRGHRGLPTLYAFEDDTLYLFGYSYPLLWLTNRGFFRKLQDGRSYTLTAKGEAAFGRLLLSGAGATISQRIEEAQLAPR